MRTRLYYFATFYCSATKLFRKGWKETLIFNPSEEDVKSTQRMGYCCRVADADTLPTGDPTTEERAAVDAVVGVYHRA